MQRRLVPLARGLDVGRRRVREQQLDGLQVVVADGERNRARALGIEIFEEGTALDENLDENAYIVPGLGDAGDRLFGTK